MLIYIGTPLMAVGLWSREDVNRVEASLYRKIMRIGNDVTHAAILNTFTNIRLAGEVIYYLSREAWDEYRRQNRVTKYFDQIEKGEATTSFVAGGSNDAVMENSGGDHQGSTSNSERRENWQNRVGGGGKRNYNQKYNT